MLRLEVVVPTLKDNQLGRAHSALRRCWPYLLLNALACSVPPAPPDAGVLRDAGQAPPCRSSADCGRWSACNVSGDPDFDPAFPIAQCRVVACDETPDCEPGETCNLAGRCTRTPCFAASDCDQEQVCHRGECVTPPLFGPDQVRCNMRLERSAVVVGSTTSFGIDVGATTIFDGTSRTSSVGRTRGGKFIAIAPGRTTIEHLRPACVSSPIIVISAREAGPARVLVTGDGAPLVGAHVESDQSTLITNIDGLATTTATFSTISASYPGFDGVTLLAPPPGDLRIPLLSTGSSMTARGTVRKGTGITAAIVGAPFASDLSLRRNARAIGREAHFTTPAPSGVSLPSGLILALTPRPISYPSDESCRTPVASGEIGCFVLAVSEPWIWALRWHASASDWNPFWGAFDTDLGNNEAAPMSLLFATVTSAQVNGVGMLAVPTSSSGVLPVEDSALFYASIHIPQVAVRNLGGVPTVAVAAVGRASGLGEIPLGVGFASDLDPIDGVVNSIAAPFGRFGQGVPDGAVSLAFVPEAAPTDDRAPSLWVIAADAQRFSTHRALEFTVILERPEPWTQAITVEGDFLPLPSIVVTRSNAHLRGIPEERAGRWMRVEVEDRAQRHSTYLRTGSPGLDLPLPRALRASLAAGTASVTVSILQFRSGFEEPFRIESDARDTAGLVQAFTVEDCRAEADAHCRLE